MGRKILTDEEKAEILTAEKGQWILDNYDHEYLIQLYNFDVDINDVINAIDDGECKINIKEAHRKDKVECECGRWVRKDDLARHRRTRKHKQRLNKKKRHCP